MMELRKFIKKCLLFFLLIGVVLLIGLLIPSRLIKENLHYTIYDKHEALERTKGSPRIILVGGSNLSFGLNSELIDNEYEGSVINAGIHAGYGLKFILDDIKPFIYENDIVVLIPEYSHFYDDYFYGGQALAQVLNVFPEALKTLSARQVFKIVENLPKESTSKIKGFLQSRIRSMDRVDSYHRNSFNSYGDATGHWNVKQAKKTFMAPVKGKFNADALDYIVAFSDYVKSKNAKLYYSYPSLNKSSFDASQEAVDRVVKEIISTGITSLGDAARFSTPDSLHYDTHYHLVKEGQDYRTNLLLEDLRRLKIVGDK